MHLVNKLGAHLSGIDHLRAMLEGDLRPGLAETLDIRLVEVDDGRVVLEGTPDVHLYNPVATVHGGFTASMMDFACGYAVHSKLKPGQSFTTLELNVAYHRAMTKETGPVRAEGRVVTFGRRAAFSEAKLTDAAGKLYASATSSLLVFSS